MRPEIRCCFLFKQQPFARAQHPAKTHTDIDPQQADFLELSYSLKVTPSHSPDPLACIQPMPNPVKYFLLFFLQLF